MAATADGSAARSRTTEYPARLKASRRSVTSPMSSESCAEPPASKMPTIRKPRRCRASVSPSPQFSNFFAIERLAISSDLPGSKGRPWRIRSSRWAPSPSGAMPRRVTFAPLVVPRLFLFTTTTSSPVATGVPSGFFATPGRVPRIRACSRETPLCTSLVAPSLMTITFCGSPVFRKVYLSPAASDIMVEKTATTRARQTTVVTVETLRTNRPRRLTLKGIAITPPSAAHRPREGAPRKCRGSGRSRGRSRPRSRPR